MKAAASHRRCLQAERYSRESRPTLFKGDSQMPPLMTPGEKSVSAEDRKAKSLGLSPSGPGQYARQAFP